MSTESPPKTYSDSPGMAVEEEVSLLCMEVSYFEVKEGQVLLEAGQPWPYIVFILRGSVSYDAWGYVVDSMATSEDSDLSLIHI